MPAAVAVPLITAGISGIGAIGGAAMSSSANRNAAAMQTNAANQAAQLQATAAKNQLAFEQQQAQQAQTNYTDTTAFNRGVYNAQQARLTPYRNFGTGSLAQLGQPLPGPGSVGSMGGGS